MAAGAANPTRTAWEGSSAAAPYPSEGDEEKADVLPALENPDRSGRPWVGGNVLPGWTWALGEPCKSHSTRISLSYAEIFQLTVGTFFFFPMHMGIFASGLKDTGSLSSRSPLAGERGQMLFISSLVHACPQNCVTWPLSISLWSFPYLIQLSKYPSHCMAGTDSFQDIHIPGQVSLE